MPVTAQLKAWIVEQSDVKEDATDDEFRKAAAGFLADGTLTPDKFAELTKDKEEAEMNEFSQVMGSLKSSVEKLTEAMAKPKEESKSEKKKIEETESGKTELGKIDKAITGGLADDECSDEKAYNIRIVNAAEKYTHNHKVLAYPTENKDGKTHPWAGQPVMNFNTFGRPMQELSRRDMAICGAYSKLIISSIRAGNSRTIGYQCLNQHDKDLLHYAMDNYEWSGWGGVGDDRFADIIERKLTPREKQTLIDDAVSGGLEAVPIVFDDQVIQTPLLHGELFPLVNVVAVDRGRRIEGVITGTVGSSWAGIDATPIPLFNTALYVTAFDTTIFRWEGAIQIGLDFLSDTPIDFGAHVTAQYGERLLEDLDDVIASGNGTTQPLGIINSAGTTVNWLGATNLGNYETLRFSVTKQEHGANFKASAVFCGTETSYQRAHSIPVGANDVRRIFGMNYDDYQIMGRPYKIVGPATLTNQQIFYCIMKRYRMYRRRGMTMQTSTEGITLRRANSFLITATARYGGQLERGAVAGMTLTAPV